MNKSLLTVTVALRSSDLGEPDGIATVYYRKLCQKRWLFCDMVTLQLLGTETWKQFFVFRTWQEHAKTRAKPEDFTYKEIPAEYGMGLGTLEETPTWFLPFCAVLHSHFNKREGIVV